MPRKHNHTKVIRCQNVFSVEIVKLNNLITKCITQKEKTDPNTFILLATFRFNDIQQKSLREHNDILLVANCNGNAQDICLSLCKINNHMYFEVGVLIKLIILPCIGNL